MRARRSASRHFDTFGWREGPSAAFDTQRYFAAYGDVALANINPLAHFLSFGIHEGRLPFGDGIWN